MDIKYGTISSRMIIFKAFKPNPFNKIDQFDFSIHFSTLFNVVVRLQCPHGSGKQNLHNGPFPKGASKQGIEFGSGARMRLDPVVSLTFSFLHWYRNHRIEFGTHDESDEKLFIK